MRFLTLVLLATCALEAHAQSTVSLVAYPDHMVGRRTASGEIYNPHGLTVAHPSLPFGSMLELSAPGTDRSVMVEVNDRGLMVGEGELIVSKAALSRLGLDGQDGATVSMRQWRPGNRPALASQDRPARPSSATVKATDSPGQTAGQTGPTKTQQPEARVATPAQRNASPAPASTRFAIQMGSFADRSAALAMAATLDGAWIQSGSAGGKPVHRVFFGHFSQRAEAEGWHARLSGLGVNGYVRSVPN